MQSIRCSLLLLRKKLREEEKKDETGYLTFINKPE